MVADFPNTPTVGDVFTVGDITRKWNGTTWSIIATTITGPTGATGPQILGATSPILWDSVNRTLSFATSGVTANTYNNSATAITPLTIDTYGRITATGASVTITPAWTSITSIPAQITGITGLSSTGTGLLKNTAGIWSYDNTTYSTYTAPTIGTTSITSGGTFTTLPGVTSVNSTTIPSSATLLTSTSTSSSLTSFGSSPTLTTPTIDTINTSLTTTGTAALWNTGLTTGNISIGGALTTGTVTIGGTGTGSTGTINILTGATTSGTKAINIGTSGTTGSTTNITVGSTGGTSTTTLNGGTIFAGQILESATVSATAAATTVTYDVLTNKNVLYYQNNATANWTFNVRGSSTVTLNTLMATGQSLTVVFMNTNGATAYYPTAFQIDGSAVTPKWFGGTAPTAGNASSTDVYTYNIIKTGSATYTVLASQNKFA